MFTKTCVSHFSMLITVYKILTVRIKVVKHLTAYYFFQNYFEQIYNPPICPLLLHISISSCI